MNLTNPFCDEDGDKLREECGIFGAINAANLKRAHALIERGAARGKIVLQGF